MADITRAQVKEYLSNLTVIELSELVKELEEEWGVSAAAPVAVAAVAGAGGAAEAAEEEEQTEFNVVLTGIGNQKIQVIKAVRELTGLGLKEAKGVVDNPGQAVKEGVSKDEANEAKEKLEGVGASVEIK